MASPRPVLVVRAAAIWVGMPFAAAGVGHLDAPSVVSDRVAVEAVRLLAAEGFVEARSGSGTYVRHRPEQQRLTRSWYTARKGGSPFRAEMGAGGRSGRWECSSERAAMTPAVAQRLGAAADPPTQPTGGPQMTVKRSRSPAPVSWSRASNCENVVGVAGFEPAVSSSRSNLSRSI